MDDTLIGTLLASTLRGATPLVLCALAGCLSERAGVIDLGLEGKMLLTAFAAASVAAVSGSWVLAFAVALALGVALSMLHAYACVSHGGDQVVTGMAITMTAAGLSVVLGAAWFKLGGQTPALPDSARLLGMGSAPGGAKTGIMNDGVSAGMSAGLNPGFGEALGQVPLLGKTLALGLAGHNALVWVTAALVGLVWWLLYRTHFGLRLRAAGENPAMVDAVGLSVKRLRYQALALNGLLAGLAGSYLVLALNPGFIPHMTAGRGYMALAALIFGRWHPVGALWACLLFGFLDALAIRLQGLDLPLLGALPVQAIQALPYVLTVILLGGFMGASRAPKALGQPYTKAR